MSTVVCWFQRTLKQLEREQTDTQTHTQDPRACAPRVNDIIVTLCACVYTTWCRVNVRKAVCACGYVFASKKSTARESKRVAMNIGRSLESADETAARKSIVNVP